MKETHTAGPWEAHPRHPGYVIPAGHAERQIGGSVYDEMDRDTYAQVIAFIYADRHGRGDREHTAHLIAAAPDLLAACKHVRAINAKAAAEGYTNPEAWGDELFAAQRVLSDAIAKASPQ